MGNELISCNYSGVNGKGEIEEKWERRRGKWKKRINKIIGYCIDVYKELGPGFLETVYHKSLESKFKDEINFPLKGIFYHEITKG